MSPSKKHLRGDIRRFKKIEHQASGIEKTIRTMRHQDEREIKNPEANPVRSADYQVQLLVDGRFEWAGPLVEFFIDNNLDQPMREMIIAELQGDGVYYGGGGAAVAYELKLVKDNPASWIKPVKDRLYECEECGKQIITKTNHLGDIYPYCSYCVKTTIHRYIRDIDWEKDQGISSKLAQGSSDRKSEYYRKQETNPQRDFGLRVTREGPIVEKNTTHITVTQVFNSPQEALRHISKADIKPDGWITEVQDWEAKKFVFVWKDGKPIYKPPFKTNPRSNATNEEKILQEFIDDHPNIKRDIELGILPRDRIEIGDNEIWVHYPGGSYPLKFNINPRGPRGGVTEVQSVLFDKGQGWTVAKAKAWAKRNGFKYGNVLVKGNSIRLRQDNP